MTHTITQSNTDHIEITQQGRFLTFSIEREMYGIDIRYVTEIVGIQPITTMPELPDYIRGIINLRGKIIPIMDVRLRFRKAFREYDGRTCIIVIDTKGLSIGLIVDSVSEVLDIPERDLVPPPRIHQSGQKYLKAIGKTDEGITLLLDCERLFSDEDLDVLDSMR
jgi:purine-binding chemotaxis protein CheW